MTWSPTENLGSPDLLLPAVAVDPDRLAGLAERWGLGSSVERVLAALAAGGHPTEE